MIDTSILNLDLSDVKDTKEKSRKIIRHIFSVRNYFLENDVKIHSIFVNKFLLKYIIEYNFIAIKKEFDENELEKFDIIGYLQELFVVYVDDLNDDEISFNIESDTRILTIKIKI